MYVKCKKMLLKFHDNIRVTLTFAIFKIMDQTVPYSKFSLHLNGGNTGQAKQWFQKCSLYYAPSETTISRWYAVFKCGRSKRH